MAMGTGNKDIQKRQTTGTGHRYMQGYATGTGKRNRERQKEQGQARGKAPRISQTLEHKSIVSVNLGLL